jgi:hypothetical protein
MDATRYSDRDRINQSIAFGLEALTAGVDAGKVLAVVAAEARLVGLNDAAGLVDQLLSRHKAPLNAN